MRTIQIIIPTNNVTLQEILIAQLAEIGFDGFEETATSLHAYANDVNFNEEAVVSLLQTHGLSHTKQIIPSQNWNAVWETNFQPIQINSFVGIRANFHAPIVHVAHEIIITPKMSFGTGHHATTYTIIQLMEHIDFNNKSVLDFGTGTGILAIIAEKLGATEIVAIDNDDWCIENATENIQANNCRAIKLQKASTISTLKKYDRVIANINKHIIEEHIHNLHNVAADNGIILLSGLLVTDEADILKQASIVGWQHQHTLTKEQWIAMQFTANVK